MTDIETFITELLEDIKEAGNKNENFDLHMEAPQVKEIADAYNNTKWIEIY